MLDLIKFGFSKANPRKETLNLAEIAEEDEVKDELESSKVSQKTNRLKTRKKAIKPINKKPEIKLNSSFKNPTSKSEFKIQGIRSLTPTISSILPNISRSKTLFLQNPPPQPAPKRLSEELLRYKSHSNTLSSKSRLGSSNSRMSLASRIARGKLNKNNFFKNRFLNPTDSNLQKKFKRICQKKTIEECFVTNDLFQKYLEKRYPEHVASVLSSNFNFGFTDFKGFLDEVDRFVSSHKEKLLYIAFQVFDFNCDKFVCYKDACSAIEQTKFSCYDYDLIEIKKLLELKKQGKLGPSKPDFRKSFMNFLIINPNPSQIVHGSSKPQTRQDAINFQDFKNMNYNFLPQIILDFVKYITKINLLKAFGVRDETPILQREPSEENIVNSKEVEGQTQERLNYLKELSDAMALYSLESAYDLLAKFKALKCNRVKNSNVISKDSLKKRLPSMFGVKCNYLAERIYYYLAGPEVSEIDKATFLRMVYPFLTGNKKTTERFVFSLYDFRNDKVLTADEIYQMFAGLPVGSHAYNECSLVVNEAVEILFQRSYKSTISITPDRFSKLVPESVILESFLEFLSKPYQELPVCQEHFASTELSKREINFRKTSISFLKTASQFSYRDK